MTPRSDIGRDLGPEPVSVLNKLSDATDDAFNDRVKLADSYVNRGRASVCTSRPRTSSILKYRPAGTSNERGLEHLGRFITDLNAAMAAEMRGDGVVVSSPWRSLVEVTSSPGDYRDVSRARSVIDDRRVRHRSEERRRQIPLQGPLPS